VLCSPSKAAYVLEKALGFVAADGGGSTVAGNTQSSFARLNGSLMLRAFTQPATIPGGGVAVVGATVAASEATLVPRLLDSLLAPIEVPKKNPE
jgi:hypothetical protein